MIWAVVRLVASLTHTKGKTSFSATVPLFFTSVLFFFFMSVLNGSTLNPLLLWCSGGVSCVFINLGCCWLWISPEGSGQHCAHARAQTHTKLYKVENTESNQTASTSEKQTRTHTSFRTIRATSCSLLKRLFSGTLSFFFSFCFWLYPPFVLSTTMNLIFLKAITEGQSASCVIFFFVLRSLKDVLFR